MCHSYVNCRLKSEVSIMLSCQLCSTRYTAVRIKSCSKSTSAIKVATMKIRMISVTNGSHHVLSIPPNRHFTVSKDEWDTEEDTDYKIKKRLDQKHDVSAYPQTPPSDDDNIAPVVPVQACNYSLPIQQVPSHPPGQEEHILSHPHGDNCLPSTNVVLLEKNS